LVQLTQLKVADALMFNVGCNIFKAKAPTSEAGQCVAPRAGKFFHKRSPGRVVPAMHGALATSEPDVYLGEDRVRPVSGSADGMFDAEHIAICGAPSERHLNY
jgi:hypothetical protein